MKKYINKLLSENNALCKVERERDKDRLESKRRIDQLTKNMEVDQQENRKKNNEVIIRYQFFCTQNFCISIPIRLQFKLNTHFYK